MTYLGSGRIFGEFEEIFRESRSFVVGYEVMLFYNGNV
jgi:hypothetical protein|tara:strand:+ start:1112 stop:1225 length:114 start_codon:yes stop_codon:yes gene_type:complete